MRGVVLAVLLTAFASSAMAKDACVVTRDAFTKVQIAAGHRVLADMPDKVFRPFKALFAEMGRFQESTGITGFEFQKDAPFTRLVFWKGKCFFDVVDMPDKIIQALLVKAQEAGDKGI